MREKRNKYGNLLLNRASNSDKTWTKGEGAIGKALCQSFGIAERVNICQSVIVARPQKRKARHPGNDDHHKNVCFSPHKAVPADMLSCKLWFHWVVGLRQVYQKYAAPI